jgi:hypothetical protein
MSMCRKARPGLAKIFQSSRGAISLTALTTTWNDTPGNPIGFIRPPWWGGPGQHLLIRAICVKDFGLLRTLYGVQN